MIISAPLALMAEIPRTPPRDRPIPGGDRHRARTFAIGIKTHRTPTHLAIPGGDRQRARTGVLGMNTSITPSHRAIDRNRHAANTWSGFDIKPTAKPPIITDKVRMDGYGNIAVGIFDMKRILCSMDGSRSGMIVKGDVAITHSVNVEEPALTRTRHSGRS